MIEEVYQAALEIEAAGRRPTAYGIAQRLQIGETTARTARDTLIAQSRWRWPITLGYGGVALVPGTGPTAEHLSVLDCARQIVAAGRAPTARAIARRIGCSPTTASNHRRVLIALDLWDASWPTRGTAFRGGVRTCTSTRPVSPRRISAGPSPGRCA